MFELNKVLEDIIEVAYPDNAKKEKYKKFYIEFQTKELKSKNGQYNEREHNLTIYNLSRSDSVIIKTSIHELAHHVDNINRGHSDHSKEFYEVYKDLLIAALNMKLFNKDVVLEGNANSADRSKVEKILNEWIPTYLPYKENEETIVVSNCYDIKNLLKERDYSYNSINQSWEKDIKTEEKESEIAFLISLNTTYEVKCTNDISVGAVGYLIANGDTYSCKSMLHSNGFKFFNKKWHKKIALQDKEKEINKLISIDELKDIVFKVGR